MTTQKQRPVHELRIGNVKAAIWANQSQKNSTWYCVTFTRIYKAKDGWKRSNGFGTNELRLLSKLADEAMLWIQQNSKPTTFPATTTNGASLQPNV